jgi:hypothetical protein
MQKLTAMFFLACLLGLTISISRADTPGAPAPGQSKTALIGPFVGRVGDDVRNYVPAAIIRTIKQYGVEGQRSQQPMDDLAKTGSIICADTGGSYLIGGSVALSQATDDNMWVVATVTINGFNCDDLKAPVRTVSYTAQSADRQTAIDIAVARILKKYLAR